MEEAAVAIEESSVARIEREVLILLRRAELAQANKSPAERLVRSAYLLLTELEKHGPLGIVALAAATHVDVSTASRQIQPLEREGLVSRVPNPDDGRGSLIQITDDGVMRLHAAREQRRSVYLELLDDWSEQDRVAFGAYLARLNQAILDRILGGSVAK